MKIVESIDGMEAYFIIHKDGEIKTMESSGFSIYELLLILAKKKSDRDGRIFFTNVYWFQLHH